LLVTSLAYYSALKLAVTVLKTRLWTIRLQDVTYQKTVHVMVTALRTRHSTQSLTTSVLFKVKRAKQRAMCKKTLRPVVVTQRPAGESQRWATVHNPTISAPKIHVQMIPLSPVTIITSPIKANSGAVNNARGSQLTLLHSVLIHLLLVQGSYNSLMRTYAGTEPV
jgi:hypothetical protein